MTVCAAFTGGSAAALPCAATPAGALLAARAEPSLASTPTATSTEAHGFRVEAVRWDPLLRQTWAVVRSCDHAERPSMTMLTDLPVAHDTANSSAAYVAGYVPVAMVRADQGSTVVRAGDVVRLWKLDQRTHIELVATAEENGGVGTRVRLRLAAPRDADGQINGQPQYVAGVVRGPADVEMER